MGSEFADLITFEQAAKMLFRSRRTVTSYVKNGVLNKVQRGRAVFLRQSEVEQLQVEIGAGFPPMNRKTFYRLCAHVQRLEMDMAVLKRMNGVYDTPLRPSTEECGALWAAARKAADQGVWTLEEIRMWADLFDKMDDVFFDVLAIGTGVADAWRPLYELCLAQARQISLMAEFKNQVQHQAVHDRLQTGLSRMRKVILVWIEAGNSKAAQEAESKMDGDTQAVLRRLTAKA
jgi:hypothetical protein